MSGKYDDHDSNRPKYHGKRRNATHTFSYSSKRNEDDQRPGSSGMRSDFDHARIGGGVSQRKHTNNRYTQSRNPLTRTIINKIKDDDILMKKDTENVQDRTTYDRDRNNRFGNQKSNLESLTRIKKKAPLARLAIGETSETKSLIPTQLYCKLASIDQSVFDIIVQFSQQYFSCFDKNRDELLAAYHPNALYSVSLNLKSQAAVKSAKFDDSYFRDSRNLLFVFDEEKQFRILHRGNFDVVASIKKMPYTEHDSESLRLDCGYFQLNMITFSITGVFREGKPDNNIRPYRNFQRTFVCVPALNNKMVIVNEQFTISNLSESQAKRYREEPAKMTTETQVVVQQEPTMTLSDEQRKAQKIEQFSRFSSLNPQWSRDVLEHSNWDIDAAQRNFLDHKDEIPKEAFI